MKKMNKMILMNYIVKNMMKNTFLQMKFIKERTKERKIKRKRKNNLYNDNCNMLFKLYKIIFCNIFYK